LAPSELRRTIAEIKSLTLKQLKDAMNDDMNWVGLMAHFHHERALADYIAAYPNHLEDGLVIHPDSKIREKVFTDKKRADVLLLDRDERPVVVECKQGSPRVEHLDQLRGYMKSVRKLTGRKDVRGILVHGGSRNIRNEVRKASKRAPRVEIIQHHLQVDFAGASGG
jgi:RecB family endonuclease NucS